MQISCSSYVQSSSCQMLERYTCTFLIEKHSSGFDVTCVIHAFQETFVQLRLDTPVCHITFNLSIQSLKNKHLLNLKVYALFQVLIAVTFPWEKGGDQKNVLASDIVFCLVATSGYLYFS